MQLFMICHVQDLVNGGLTMWYLVQMVKLFILLCYEKEGDI